MKPAKKEELIKELEKLRRDFRNCTDFMQKKYIVSRIGDFVKELELQKYRPEDLNPIRNRFKNIEKYTKIYEYSLANQLKEQKTIVYDSIQSSPFHLKKLELKNTAMVQFTDQTQK